MGGYFNKEIVAWRDLDQLYEKFSSIAFQVDSSVLDLPESIDETIETEFTPEGERVYREMENEMITWIRTMDEERVPVTAANSMVRLTRLQQITGGSLPDEQLQPVIVDTAKERLLEDFLADVGPEPVVVFAVYKADLAAIHRAARMNYLASGEVSGARDDLSAWQRGGKSDPTVLAVQMQSGAEGIDMTRARLAVYYSHGYSLALYKQSRARILRPPQKKPVAFYHLQVKSSIDQYVLRAVLARQDLVEGVLKGLRKS
jgi:superfamily II DNA or RNA helicase